MLKIKISQLEVFAAVVDAGSFSKAAIELDCAQSRISHAIGELEQLVGTRLLERTRGGSVPTEAGQRMLLRARDVLSSVASMEATATHGEQLIGQLRLACFRSVATHVLPYALAALARDHPGIRVEIDDSCDRADEIEEAVRSGRIDMGVSCAPCSDALVVRPMLSDEYVLIVPRGHRLHAPFSWQQLAGLDLIEPISPLSMRVIEQLRSAGLNAPSTHRQLSDGSVMAMIALGRAFSVFPRLATLPLPAGVAEVALPLPLAFRRDTVLIATPETARKPVANAVLRALSARHNLTQTAAYRSGAYTA